MLLVVLPPALQGTPAYQAPEVRDHGRMFKSSDVYSFGIVLWELVSGKCVADVGATGATASAGSREGGQQGEGEGEGEIFTISAWRPGRGQGQGQGQEGGKTEELGLQQQVRCWWPEGGCRARWVSLHVHLRRRLCHCSTEWLCGIYEK